MRRLSAGLVDAHPSFTQISREPLWQVIRYPLQLEPLTRLKYFEEREKFDPTVYLKNPMVLMGLMMAFMAFVMPKMVSVPALPCARRNFTRRCCSSSLLAHARQPLLPWCTFAISSGRGGAGRAETAPRQRVLMVARRAGGELGPRGTQSVAGEHEGGGRPAKDAGDCRQGANVRECEHESSEMLRRAHNAPDLDDEPYNINKHVHVCLVGSHSPRGLR